MSGTNDNLAVNPALKFNRAVKGLQHYDGGRLVELFVEAVENDFPRDGLLKYITSGEMHAGVSTTPSARDFIAWCRATAPHLARLGSGDAPREAIKHDAPPEDQEAARAKLRADAERLLASETFDLERWIEASEERAQDFLAWQ